jgi:hypothetical protein
VYLLVQSPEGEFSIYNNCDDGWPPSQNTNSGISEQQTSQSLDELKAQQQRTQNNTRAKISKFEKRKDRLLMYANDFANQLQARVYLAIQCQSGYAIVYNSSSSRRWPPSKRQVVSIAYTLIQPL